MSIDPKKTAVVLIEYQNDFTSEGGVLHGAVSEVMDQTKMLSKTKDVVDAARSAGATVMYAPIMFAEGYHEISEHPYGILKGVVDGNAFVKGSWGAAIVDELAPAEGDIVIEGKRGLDTFASTNLDFILRSKGIETLVLGGFLTNCCVESTMRSGYENGYQVITLSDCVAATSPEEARERVKYDYPMFSHPMPAADFIDQLGTLTNPERAAAQGLTARPTRSEAARHSSFAIRDGISSLPYRNDNRPRRVAVAQPGYQGGRARDAFAELPVLRDGRSRRDSAQLGLELLRVGVGAGREPAQLVALQEPVPLARAHPHQQRLAERGGVGRHVEADLEVLEIRRSRRLGHLDHRHPPVLEQPEVGAQPHSVGELAEHHSRIWRAGQRRHEVVETARDGVADHVRAIGHPDEIPLVGQRADQVIARRDVQVAVPGDGLDGKSGMSADRLERGRASPARRSARSRRGDRPPVPRRCRRTAGPCLTSISAVATRPPPPS